MPKLIKDGVITENTWTLIAKAEGDAAAVEVPAGQVLIPVAVWIAQKDQLQNRSDIGVWFDSDEAADLIGEDANRFAVIGGNFP